MALFLNPMFLFPIGLKMYAMSVLFLFQHFTYPVFQTGPKKCYSLRLNLIVNIV